jgi:hypothetical protein
MGKQVNFYMHSKDEFTFVENAKKIAPISILEYTSKTEALEPLTELPEKGVPGWFQLWLWSPERCLPPIVRWVPQQRYFVIDAVDSEVIEFGRSYQHEHSIVRGRLWAEVIARGSKSKSHSFTVWFESLMKLLKKSYRKLPSGEYIGPAADQFVANGGSLRQFLTAPVVRVVHH